MSVRVTFDVLEHILIITCYNGSAYRNFHLRYGFQQRISPYNKDFCNELMFFDAVKSRFETKLPFFKLQLIKNIMRIGHN